MNFFEFYTLEKELEILPPFHQVAFAAACCERLLPNYNAFCRQVDWGDPSVPRNALDEVWQILAGKRVDATKIEQLIEACGDEHIFPDDLDFGGQYCMEAQEAPNPNSSQSLNHPIRGEKLIFARSGAVE